MNYNRLPNETTILVTGVISLVFSVTAACLGLSIVGLILGIVGLVKANKAIKLYHQNSKLYSEESYNKIKKAKDVNLAGVIINSVATILAVIIISYYSTEIYNIFQSDNSLKEKLIQLEQEEFPAKDADN